MADGIDKIITGNGTHRSYTEKELQYFEQNKNKIENRPNVFVLTSGNDEAIVEDTRITKEFARYLLLLETEDKTNIKKALQEEVKAVEPEDLKKKVFKEFVVSSYSGWKMKRIEYNKELEKLNKALESLGPNKTTKCGTKTAGLTSTGEHGILLQDVEERWQKTFKRFKEARYLHEWIRDASSANFMRDNEKFFDKEMGLIDSNVEKRIKSFISAIEAYN